MGQGTTKICLIFDFIGHKSNMKKPQKPVLIALEDEPNMPDLAEAPIVRDTPLTTASTVTGSAQQRSRGLARSLFGLLICVLSFLLSVLIWDFTVCLFSRHVVLGWSFSALLGLLGVAVILTTRREIRAILELQKINYLRISAAQALAQNNLE
jgi:uncharacterized membrane protein YcjF (UPF0283 family)